MHTLSSMSSASSFSDCKDAADTSNQAQNLPSPIDLFGLRPSATGECSYQFTKLCLIWAAKKLNKSILELSADDYKHLGLTFLLESGNLSNVDEVNSRVFYDLMGKLSTPLDPNNSFPIQGSKVLVFSPHPDDDVISMGLTLRRLRQHNNVHVAYCVSGTIAVSAADARRRLGFIQEFTDLISSESKCSTACDVTQSVDLAEVENPVTEVAKGLDAAILKEGESLSKSSDLFNLAKAAIRRTEALGALEELNPSQDPTELRSKTHFLDLPFYGNGHVKSSPTSVDTSIVVDLLKKVQPDHIFMAADLEDPHGTHMVCYEVIREALEKVYPQVDDSVPDTLLNPFRVLSDPHGVDTTNKKWDLQKNVVTERPLCWFYRGAWSEFSVGNADLLVLSSETELQTKLFSILRHESQTRALYPGDDPRPFVERAEERNRMTARSLAALGLPRAAGAEAFVCGLRPPCPEEVLNVSQNL